MITKKHIILISVLFLVGVLIAVIVYYVASLGKFEIKNFNDYYKRLSPKYQDIVTNGVYQSVQLNTSEGVKGSETGKGLIRDETVVFDTESESGSSTFIVDFEKIRQSYFVTFNYSFLTDESLGGYPVLVTCLTEEKDIIYPEFSCKNIFPSDDELFPELSALPVDMPNWEVTYYLDDNNKPVLVATIQMLYLYTTRARASYAGYQKEVLAWLKENNISQDTYTIEWRDIRNETILTSSTQEEGDENFILD